MDGIHQLRSLSNTSHSFNRSTHNIRAERSWRDVRKDTLEVFRKIFEFLEDTNLLDMENTVHRVCLYIVFQPRIQASLNRTVYSWNHHKMRTEHYKTPYSIYELSKAKAINRGYWDSDPGDDIVTASHADYGHESERESLPPADELLDDPPAPDRREYALREDEYSAGVFVNDDDEIQWGRELLVGLDIGRDDDNWGIDVYCEAVLLAKSRVNN